jgi:hypothetical protein
LLFQKPATLRQWRWQKKGPPFMRIGKRVLYRRSDLAAHVEAQRRDPAASRNTSPAA